MQVCSQVLPKHINALCERIIIFLMLNLVVHKVSNVLYRVKLPRSTCSPDTVLYYSSDTPNVHHPLSNKFHTCGGARCFVGVIIQHLVSGMIARMLLRSDTR